MRGLKRDPSSRNLDNLHGEVGTIPWTIRRLLGLIGIASSTLGIVTFLDQTRPEWMLLATISGLTERAGRFWDLLPELQIGPVGLGHVILGLLGLVLFILLFYTPHSRAKWEQYQFRRRQQQFQQKVLAQLQDKEEGLGTRRAQEPPAVVSHSATEVVNAPANRVWDALTAANCGPAFEDLLDEVVAVSKADDSVEWKGEGTVAGKEIAVAGTTRLAAPNRLEAVCTTGPLKTLQTSYELEAEGGRTIVRQEAGFDAGSIPEEFASLGKGLAVLVHHTLRRDLKRLREDVEGPLPKARELSP